MAIISAGYDGTIDEVQWAHLTPQLGVDYAVSTPGAWRVTTVQGADRTVAVAAGTGTGRGVQDLSDSAVQLQGEVVESGSRWDLVVARRDWQPEEGTTTFELLTGTATKQLPAARENDPGVVDDQPLALVRFVAGQQLPAEIIGLRCWAGNGGVVAESPEALEYLGAAPGSCVVVDRTMWVRTVTAQGAAAWVRLRVDADDVATGVLHADRIPGLNANKIAAGVLAVARIPALPASRIGSGRLDIARMPTALPSQAQAVNGVVPIRNSNGGQVTIPWPTPFASTPFAVASITTNTTQYNVASVSPTASGVTVRVARNDSAQVVSADLGVHVIGMRN